jgi:Iron only nitrogenase protein AnfO (AnfO_nitrog).
MIIKGGGFMNRQIAVLFDGNYRIASFDNVTNITVLKKENEEWIADCKIPYVVSGLEDILVLQSVKAAIRHMKDCRVIVGESFPEPVAEYLCGLGFIMRREQRFSSALLDEISEELYSDSCAAL